MKQFEEFLIESLRGDDVFGHGYEDFLIKYNKRIVRGGHSDVIRKYVYEFYIPIKGKEEERYWYTAKFVADIRSGRSDLGYRFYFKSNKDDSDNRLDYVVKNEKLSVPFVRRLYHTLYEIIRDFIKNVNFYKIDYVIDHKINKPWGSFNKSLRKVFRRVIPLVAKSFGLHYYIRQHPKRLNFPAYYTLYGKGYEKKFMSPKEPNLDVEFG